LNPKSQVSRGLKGQAIDSPIILVFRESPGGLSEVSHRPGDLVSAVGQGEIETIIYFPEDLVSFRSIEKLFSLQERLMDRLEKAGFTPEEVGEALVGPLSEVSSKLKGSKAFRDFKRLDEEIEETQNFGEFSPRGELRKLRELAEREGIELKIGRRTDEGTPILRGEGAATKEKVTELAKEGEGLKNIDEVQVRFEDHLSSLSQQHPSP